MSTGTVLFCRRCGTRGAGADGFCPTCRQNALLRRKKRQTSPVYWTVAAVAAALMIGLFVLVRAGSIPVALAPATVAERQVDESSPPPDPQTSHEPRQATPLAAKAMIQSEQEHQDAPSSELTKPKAQPARLEANLAPQPLVVLPKRQDSTTSPGKEPAVSSTRQDAAEPHKQLTPPVAPVSKLDQLKRSGQYFFGTGKELAAIGPQLAEKKVSLMATVTSMSNAFAGEAGITDFVSKDGAMKIRVRWSQCPRGLREYFQLIKQRKGNELSLQGVVESYDDGLCILRVEHYQER